MRLMPFAALLPLAACGGGGASTAISINTSDSDGNITLGSDGNGQVAINSPLFKGKFTLPKLKINAADFDLNGVHLYPGSIISGMNVDARDGPGDKDGPGDDAKVRVTFSSPAAPGTVRDWFKGKLDAAGFKVTADGSGLSGTTDENKPFKLDLAPDGGDKAKGTILIG